jgi:putative transposase
MLEPSKYYHIFNHANGDDILFRNDENHYFFLRKYQHHISPVADTYAYCLMPNHFHFLVKIKSEAELFVYLKTFPKFKTLEKFNELDDKVISNFLSKQFANLFSSYTQAFNKMYNRRGSLFLKNFKQKEVIDNAYFINLIRYIHANPIHHGFTKNMSDWKFSSYNSFFSEKPTLLNRMDVINFFGGYDLFLKHPSTG